MRRLITPSRLCASLHTPWKHLPLHSPFSSVAALKPASLTAAVVTTQSNEQLPSSIYSNMCEQGKINSDSMQLSVTKLLDSLYQDLPSYQQSMKGYFTQLAAYKKQYDQVNSTIYQEKVKAWDIRQASFTFKTQSAVYEKLLTSPVKSLREDAEAFFEDLEDVTLVTHSDILARMTLTHPTLPDIPKGLYIHGSVGTGKSLLMDVLYTSAEERLILKRRVHFNTFLMEVHAMPHHTLYLLSLSHITPPFIPYSSYARIYLSICLCTCVWLE